MGYYINPEDMSKEEFLKLHGTPIRSVDVKSVPNDTLPVCLVDNGLFTAAGIIYSSQEADEFLRVDGRRKQWFSALRGQAAAVLQ